MHVITRDKVVYTMSAKNEPVLWVRSGSTVVFETCDALHGQIKNERQSFDGLDWNNINPATGPLYINEAEPGDQLAVSIDKIHVADKGVVMCGPGMGVLPDLLEKSEAKVMHIWKDEAILAGKFKIPLNKMVGVIGVAPAQGEIPCGVPDYHGGNMDCKEIREGATVLLPVLVHGALLSIGDLHAIMADGEVGVSGLEVEGAVTVTVKVIKDWDYPTPLVSNKTHIMTLASHEDLDEAVKMATENMIKYLAKIERYEPSEALMLLSMAGDVRICQVVDPKKTARIELSREYTTFRDFVPKFTRKHSLDEI